MRLLTKEQIEFYNELAVRSTHNVRVAFIEWGCRPVKYTLNGKFKRDEDGHFRFGIKTMIRGDHFICSKLGEIKPYLLPKEQFHELITEKESLMSDHELINWFYVNHIDKDGMIEKGFAIKAPNEIYNSVE